MTYGFVAVFFAADVQPIQDFPGSCSDRRYPAIFGDWVVGCGSNGHVDRAISLLDGKLIRLPTSSESVGFGEVPVFGRRGVYDWQDARLNSTVRIINEMVAPSFNQHDRIASLESDQVRLRVGAKSWTASANPRGWYPPALLGQQVIWVNDDGDGGSDLMSWRPGESVEVYAGGDGEQRHVVSSKTHVAYLDSNQVVVRNQAAQITASYSAIVIDRLSIWEDNVCWSAWSTEDIDIFCSNGFHLARKGHQLWPSHSDKALVFQEEGQVMILPLTQ